MTNVHLAFGTMDHRVWLSGDTLDGPTDDMIVESARSARTYLAD